MFGYNIRDTERHNPFFALFLSSFPRAQTYLAEDTFGACCVVWCGVQFFAIQSVHVHFSRRPYHVIFPARKGDSFVSPPRINVCIFLTFLYLAFLLRYYLRNDKIIEIYMYSGVRNSFAMAVLWIPWVLGSLGGWNGWPEIYDCMHACMH